MKGQIGLAFDEIKHRWKFHLIFFVQIFLAILLIGYGIYDSGKMIRFRDSLESLGNAENIYMMFENDDDEKINSVLSGENDSREREAQFYSYIKNSDKFDSYTIDGADAELRDIGFDDDRDSEPILMGDMNFVKIYGIKSSSGVSAEDIVSGKVHEKDGALPALAGSDLAKKYKIGDVVKGHTGKDYYIAGYLPKEAHYMLPNWTEKPIYMKDRLFAALDIDYSFVSAVLQSTYIITDDPKDLKDIQAKSDELGLFSYQFKSFKTQFELIKYYEMKYIGYALVTFGLLMLVCVVCMISSLLVFIEEHIKEFAIHLTSGARISDLAFRIVFQVGILFVIPIILTAVIFKSFTLLLWLMLTAVVLIFIITAAPVIRLNTLGINGILRRCE